MIALVLNKGGSGGPVVISLVNCLTLLLLLLHMCSFFHFFLTKFLHKNPILLTLRDVIPTTVIQPDKAVIWWTEQAFVV
jgi:hypothetical protein